jgi:hypothetical protein
MCSVVCLCVNYYCIRCVFVCVCVTYCCTSEKSRDIRTSVTQKVKTKILNRASERYFFIIILGVSRFCS